MRKRLHFSLFPGCYLTLCWQKGGETKRRIKNTKVALFFCQTRRFAFGNECCGLVWEWQWYNMWPHCLTCYSGILIIYLILFLFFLTSSNNQHISIAVKATVCCTDDSCLCSTWTFTNAAGNIWSGMFLRAYDWRTSRCSWLLKVVKMWSQSCTVGEEC